MCMERWLHILVKVCNTMWKHTQYYSSSHLRWITLACSFSKHENMSNWGIAVSSHKLETDGTVTSNCFTSSNASVHFPLFLLICIIFSCSLSFKKSTRFSFTRGMEAGSAWVIIIHYTALTRNFSKNFGFEKV